MERQRYCTVSLYCCCLSVCSIASRYKVHSVCRLRLEVRYAPVESVCNVNKAGVRSWWPTSRRSVLQRSVCLDCKARGVLFDALGMSGGLDVGSRQWHWATGRSGRKGTQCGYYDVSWPPLSRAGPRDAVTLHHNSICCHIFYIYTFGRLISLCLSVRFNCLFCL